VKVDADKDSATGQAFQISGFPTIKFFSNGTQVDEVGGANAPKIKSIAQKLVSENSGASGSKNDGDDESKDDDAREKSLLTCRFHGVMLGDAMYRALETQQDKLKENKYTKAYAAAKYRWSRMINGKWMDYPMSTALKLEKAYMKKQSRVKIELSGGDEVYEIDMESDPMKQINTKRLGEEFVVRRLVLKFEDAVRRAKRILTDGFDEADGDSSRSKKQAAVYYKWQVNIGGGRWVDYAKDVSMTFEEGMKKKLKQIPFMFGSNRYVLDVDRNCQQNVQTHNELPARRVVDEERTPKNVMEEATKATALVKRPDAKGAAMVWQRCVDEDMFWERVEDEEDEEEEENSKMEESKEQENDSVWKNMSASVSERVENDYVHQYLSSEDKKRKRIVLFDNTMFRSDAPKSSRVCEIRRMIVKTSYLNQVKAALTQEPIWEVQLDDGFKPYSIQEQSTLEREYLAKNGSAIVTNAWGTYAISFDAMTQTSLKTNFARKVRRRTAIVPTISVEEKQEDKSGRDLEAHWFRRQGQEWIPMNQNTCRALDRCISNRREISRALRKGKTPPRPRFNASHSLLSKKMLVALMPVEIDESFDQITILRRKFDAHAAARLEQSAMRNMGNKKDNLGKDRLSNAVVLFKEPVSWEIPNEQPKTKGFVSTLLESLSDHKEFVIGKDADELCSGIVEAAKVGRGLDSGPNLNQEKEKEQEQEQEQEKEKEKQKEKVEQPPIAHDPPPQAWTYGSITTEKGISSIVRGRSGVFYPAKQLRLVTSTKQNNARAQQWQLNEGGTLPFSNNLFISQNWTRRYIASHRKIKNVMVLAKITSGDQDYAVLLLSLLEAQTLRHLVNHKFDRSKSGGKIVECKTVPDLMNRMRDAQPGQLVVAMFSMQGCGYCKQLAPKIVSLASKHVDVLFLKTKDTQGASSAHGIRGFPQIIFFKDGNEITPRPRGGVPPPGTIEGVIASNPWTNPMRQQHKKKNDDVRVLVQTLSGLPLTDPTAVGGPLVSSTSMYRGVSGAGASDRKVIQGARFLNSEVWYNTHEVIACLDQFESSKPLDRQTFFEQLQASRRRIFKSWDGLPVQHIFTQLDSSNLRAQLTLSGKLSLNPKELRALLLRFDKNNSGWLTEENLARAFESTGNLNRQESKLLAMVTVEQGGQIQEKRVDTSSPLTNHAPAPGALTLSPSKSISSLHSSSMSSISSSSSSSQTVSVIGRSAAERLLSNMMIQAMSMTNKDEEKKRTFHRTETPGIATFEKKKNEDEPIQCSVNAKLRPFVLASVMELRNKEKKHWHVNKVRTANAGWDDKGEFINLSLYCCVGTNCELKRFMVRKKGDGSAGSVALYG
jgi:thiol-disulfide isomerase/thioredoxin